jgi:hypothetical protein
MAQQYMLHAQTGVSYRNSALRENPSNHTVIQRIVNPTYKDAKCANKAEQTQMLLVQPKIISIFIDREISQQV